MARECDGVNDESVRKNQIYNIQISGDNTSFWGPEEKKKTSTQNGGECAKKPRAVTASAVEMNRNKIYIGQNKNWEEKKICIEKFFCQFEMMKGIDCTAEKWRGRRTVRKQSN